MMKLAVLVRMDSAGSIIHPTGHCLHLRFNPHLSF
jgi:hypothetical protein